MKIGELAKTTGISVRSLRHYEKQGLLASARLDNGYREYSKLAVGQVNTIKLVFEPWLVHAIRLENPQENGEN